MKILVVGSGGREHALIRKIGESELACRIFCAPGNAGTDAMAKNINIGVDDTEALLAFAKTERIDLTIIGPELPLVNGIVDEFTAVGLKILGPTKRAARLEGSKIFAKELLRKYGIPTADFHVWSSNNMDANGIIQNLATFGLPVVIKAAGLCAGKGVTVCHNLTDVADAISDLARQKFGYAGWRFIIENFLPGREVSYIAVVDKNGNILPLASSQDHKTIFDHDSGISPNPNTGGMGAISPSPIVTPEMEERILTEIIRPTVDAMADEGSLFVGFLYAGLMIDDAGNPIVVEFNARLGDPETQPILARMITDPLEIILAAMEGNLDKIKIEWDPRPAVSIVMSSDGYPGSYEKGFVISGLEEAEKNGAIIGHSGTALNQEGEIITAGGRVLTVTALGNNFREAQASAYEAVSKISWPGCYCRQDIGWQAIEK